MRYKTASAALLALLIACSCSGPSKETDKPKSIDASPGKIVEDAGSPETADKDSEPSVLHPVKRGETLWAIARAYDLRVVDILNANDMTQSDAVKLQAGSKLTIPGADQVLTVLEEPASDPQNPDSAEAADKTPKGKGVNHILARGETLWDMARIFAVPVGEIMAANSLTADDVSSLREGRSLFVPGVERDIKGKIKKRISKRERRIKARAEKLARKLGLGTRKTASMLLTGNVEKKWIAAASRRPGRMPGTLRWPVTNGWFVRGYGSGKDGYHLAVDIAGEIGWNVRSAAAGIVGYSGDGVKGYGNIVMVIHSGGWATIYAHNSINFVVAGQKVKRGEILAELGSTGISKGPHVHFEFVHNRKNCDPAVLFRPGIKRKDGTLSSLEYTTWREKKKKPKWVKCAPRRNYPHDKNVDGETTED